MKVSFSIKSLCFIASAFSLFVNSHVNANVNSSVKVNIEEERVEKAQQAMPVINEFFDWSSFKNYWMKVDNYTFAKQSLSLLGDELWQYSKQQSQSGTLVDDRPLYWTRLSIIYYVKNHPAKFSVSELTALIESFETASRGQRDLAYSKSTDKRILLTGFDPFFLDKNIKQSNPSGLAALLLDGTVIELKEGDKVITAEINTAMIPVRYTDFDQGEIERLLAPFYALNNVDMITTVSMGRSHFDLEHYPGLRRSAAAPDNLNIYTGANQTNPLIPNLLANPLHGEEFVLFSLPYQVMMKAKGKYKINDNRTVTILANDKPKDITVNKLLDLHDKVSVQGGGGGYLSNEISYRSINLRNKLGSTIPTGHIHTPRISDFNPETNKAIIDQINAMLVLSLTDI